MYNITSLKYMLYIMIYDMIYISYIKKSHFIAQHSTFSTQVQHMIFVIYKTMYISRLHVDHITHLECMLV